MVMSNTSQTGISVPRVNITWEDIMNMANQIRMQNQQGGSAGVMSGATPAGGMAGGSVMRGGDIPGGLGSAGPRTAIGDMNLPGARGTISTATPATTARTDGGFKTMSPPRADGRNNSVKTRATQRKSRTGQPILDYMGPSDQAMANAKSMISSWGMATQK